MTSQDSTPDQPLPALHPDRIPPHNLIYWTAANSPTEWKNSETPYTAWLRSMQEAERVAGNDDSPENDTGVAK